MQLKLYNCPFFSVGHELKCGLYLLILLVIVIPIKGWSKGNFVGQIKGGDLTSFILKRNGESQQIKATFFLKIGDEIFPSAQCSKGARLEISLSSPSKKETLYCSSKSFRVGKPKPPGPFESLLRTWEHWFQKNFGSSSTEQDETYPLMSSRNEGSLHSLLFELPEGQTVTLFSGKKKLHLAWQGGKGEYEVQVYKGNKRICKKRRIKNHFYTCDLKEALTVGDDYEFFIEDRVKKLSWNFKVIDEKANKMKAEDEQLKFEAYQCWIEKCNK